MTGAPLLRRLGLAGEKHDRRLTWSLVALGLALYTVGYAAFYPRGVTNDDEGLYIEETSLWVQTGSLRTEKIDPLTGGRESVLAGDYPLGMVTLMAPFVKAFGWRGAFLPSFISLVITVLATACWLRDERRSPAFALIVLGFPAVIVGGRLAMSDLARTAFTALGLWFFFRGLGAHKGWWLASGLVAGASLTLRESAVLPFVPLFAGTVVRRDRGWVWLLIGGLAGTSLHLVGNQLAFGDPLFVRGGGYLLDLGTIHQRLPLYLLGLLVLVPGGLLFGLAYRGRRRPEIVATVLIFFCFYLFQAFGMIETSFLKRLVLGLRYFDPLLPVLAFAMAESMPRLLAGWLPSHPNRLASAAAALWLAGTFVAAFAVHPVLDRWAESQFRMRDALARHVPTDAVLVASEHSLRKFIDDLARPYETLHRSEVSPEQLDALRERYGRVFVALLDRSDSAYWREDAGHNAAFIEGLGDPEPFVDLRVTETDRLRIWRFDTAP